MCLAPNLIHANGYPMLAACRGCRLCRQNRVNDLVGRSIAEQSVSAAAYSVTLTYAGDSPSAAILRYDDVQRFFKRLRKDYDVRYIACGEYGSKKGRAHWHVILFFAGDSPEVVRASRRTSTKQIVLPRFNNDPEARIDWAPWTNEAEGRGFAYFQEPDYRGFAYALKYALKDIDENNVRAFDMSKKPPLGDAFFRQMASDAALRQLPLHSPEYRFAHVRNKDGRARAYWLQGKSRENFAAQYIASWRAANPALPVPDTDFMVPYLDREYFAAMGEADRLEADKLALSREVARADASRPKYPRIEPDPDPEEMCSDNLELGRFDFLGCIGLPELGPSAILAFYRHGVPILWKGIEKWLLDEHDSVEAQLLRLGASKSSAKAVCLFQSELFGVVKLHDNTPPF